MYFYDTVFMGAVALLELVSTGGYWYYFFGFCSIYGFAKRVSFKKNKFAFLYFYIFFIFDSAQDTLLFL
jgi:hypothetical protein